MLLLAIAVVASFSFALSQLHILAMLQLKMVLFHLQSWPLSLFVGNLLTMVDSEGSGTLKVASTHIDWLMLMNVC